MPMLPPNFNGLVRLTCHFAAAHSVMSDLRICAYLHCDTEFNQLNQLICNFPDETAQFDNAWLNT
jgi:hypothetical protein